MISQYIKDSKGNKRGMLVALQNQYTGYVTIGWSLCNKKDKFSKIRARFIATGRAARNRHTIDIQDVMRNHTHPDIIKLNISEFSIRVARYFKITGDWSEIKVA